MVALAGAFVAGWLGLLGGAAVFAFGLFSAATDIAVVAATAGAVAALGLIGAPLAGHALRRIRGGQPLSWHVPLPVGAIAAITAIVVTLLGELLLGVRLLRPVVVLPASVLAVAAPTLAVVALAVRSRPGFSRLRAWAHFAAGAWFSTGLALVLELVLALIALAVVGGVLAVVAPAEYAEIFGLLKDVAQGGPVEPLLPWVLRPWVIGLLLVGFGGVVPLIEEGAKIAGVAVLARRLTPAAGYAGGVLAGAGFAFAESLGNLAGAIDVWAFVVLTRISTLVLHTFTTGLIGWGLGRRDRRRALLAFAGALLAHGLWNSAVVVVVVLSLALANGAAAATQMLLGVGIVGAGMFLLAILAVCFGGLIVLARLAGGDADPG